MAILSNSFGELIVNIFDQVHGSGKEMWKTKGKKKDLFLAMDAI